MKADQPDDAPSPGEVSVRAEQPGDEAEVRAVNLEAFEGSGEADLVDRLRGAGVAEISLVAVTGEGRIVGHILLTRTVVRLPLARLGELAEEVPAGLGLAPVAVSPRWQRHGVGTVLVEAALEQARGRGTPFVVVLGHPGYYPRFGFDPASRHGLRSEYTDVPDDAFMVTVFDAEVVGGLHGLGTATVCYRPEFAELA